MTQDAQVIVDLTLKSAEFKKGADGKEYSAQPVHRVMHDPTPDTLSVSTLSGLAEYIKIHEKEVVENGGFLVVDGPRHVRLMSRLNPDSMKRKVYVGASVDRELEFKFGNFIEHETFLIQLNSLFVENTDQKLLTGFVSRINSEDGITVEDDGVTQRATLKSGLSGALKEGKSAPASVKLMPYRTFSEIDQPASQFLFRMKKTYDGKGVSCALFASDGDIWKKGCVVAIAKWLKANVSSKVHVIC